jgi:hypothetical protein
MITARYLGLAAAILYAACAAYVVIDERSHPGFLSNMGTFLITAPISMPLSYFGFEPDVRNLAIVVAMVLGNAALLFQVVSGLASLFMR